MGNNAETSEPKQREFGTGLSCIIGGAVWWFLCSQPSTLALMLAAFALFYLFLGYCLLAVLLPGPEAVGRNEAFVPLPQADIDRRKSLTY